jgi:signal transduction histidine kinase/CheY-like chemotaxis protein
LFFYQSRFFFLSLFALFSLAGGITLFTLRISISGQELNGPFEISQGNTSIGQIEMPFSGGIEATLDQPVVIDIEIELDGSLKQPSIMVERPLHYIEARWDDKLITVPLKEQKGRSELIVILPDSTGKHQLQLIVQGAYGEIGIADRLVLLEWEEARDYINYRVGTGIFILSILLFATLSLLLLLAFRPVQMELYAFAGFFLALSCVCLSGVDVWYVFFEDAQLQLRFKTFAICFSIAMALQVLQTVNQIVFRWIRELSGIFIIIAILSLVIPDIVLVQKVRFCIYFVSILLVVFALYSLVRAIRLRQRDSLVFWSISGVLWLGGVLDLLALLGYTRLPPSMPIASVLFAVGATVYLFVRSSDLARRYVQWTEQTSDVIVIINDEGRILEANQAAISLGLFPNHNVQQVLESSDSVFLEHLTLKSPRAEFLIVSSGLHFDSLLFQIENNRWMLVWRDITERKQMEDQVLLSAKLETVGLFTSGLAHDFNNLLSAMMGQLSLIELEQKVNPHRVEALTNLIQAGAHSVRRILSLVRESEDTPTVIPLPDILKQFEQLGGTFVPSDCDFRIERLTTNVNLLVNQGEIEQILLNLLLNALDAIGTEPGWVTLCCRTEEDRLVFTMSDSGAGMDIGFRDRIFEPFFTAKDPSVGTGIGLTVSKRIAERYGGQLKLLSAISEQGTQFELSLPVIHNPELVSNSNEICILVLEDEVMILEVITEILEMNGHKVFACSTVQQAEKEILLQKFDVLISDVILSPNHRGPDFARHAQEIQPSLKVLLISGYAPQNHTDELNNWCFLSKPFQSQQLINMIQILMSKDK